MATTGNLSLETVQAYRVLCEFCSLVLCESPSDEVLDRLIEQRALMLEQPFSAVAPAAASQLHDVLARAASEEGAAVKTALRRDYAYLFYMVGSSGTSPFESVYRTDDRTMFGPTTLEVLEAYRAWGVQVPGQGSVPDDHLGFELLFLAHVLGEAERAMAGEDEDADASAAASAEAQRALDAARALLADHVLVFAPVFLANVKTRAKEPAYRAVAELAAASIASLAASLGARASETIDEAAYLLGEPL